LADWQILKAVAVRVGEIAERRTIVLEQAKSELMNYLKSVSRRWNFLMMRS
jgi:hypothetical protein